MALTTAQRAFELAQLGFYVFPVRQDKTPYSENGLKDSSNDPWYVQEWFERYPSSYPAIHCGPSGILVLDIDHKEDADGNTTVDGFESLDLAWYEIPTSFAYPSLSGNGRHIMYRAPEGKNLAPKAGYRGMKGVDRRSGESYVVFTSEELPDKATLTDAPEWLCDESQVRSADKFSGTVQEWFDTLEPGEPNSLVRRAIDDAKAQFERQGNDLSHSDLVEMQHRSIRLGAERNAGVPELLATLEELVESRTGDHSRTPDEYAYEFAEALASGIEKHGDAIELSKNLPAYSLNIVPSAVPDRLISGAAGNKDTFRELLAELTKATDDDKVITSVLWNSPRTKDISREWGLTFVNERVISARTRPEPVRENPTLPTVEWQKDTVNGTIVPTSGKAVDENTTNVVSKQGFLTASEQAQVDETHTFIDSYVEATRAKGFTNLIYAIPSAWTCLSMAFGRRAFIPLSKPLEVNLWMIILGESTTGKGTEDRFLRGVLNAMFLDGETDNYNLGALSSPDGLHLGLINRDGLPSIIHNDEASDFFRDIRTKDWMAPVPDKLAKWYDSFVEPSSKISLKDARGKSAHTSLNQLMWGTPDRMLTLLDASQFESGYLARVNWVWDGTIPDPNRKSDLRLQENMKRETPDEVYDVASDLLHAGKALQGRVAVGGTEKAQKRLNKAADDFRKAARKSSRYTFFKPAVDRLVMETLWKCAALLALYRGDKEFTELDAWVAIHYASDWLLTLMKVSESISESPYSRDLEEMESFIRDEGGTVSRAKLLNQFRGKVLRSGRELEDRVGFLIDSGRVNRKEEDRAIVYSLNGN